MTLATLTTVLFSRQTIVSYLIFWDPVSPLNCCFSARFSPTNNGLGTQTATTRTRGHNRWVIVGCWWTELRNAAHKRSAACSQEDGHPSYPRPEASTQQRHRLPASLPKSSVFPPYRPLDLSTSRQSRLFWSVTSRRPRRASKCKQPDSGCKMVFLWQQRQWYHLGSHTSTNWHVTTRPRTRSLETEVTQDGCGWKHVPARDLNTGVWKTHLLTWLR